MVKSSRRPGPQMSFNLFQFSQPFKYSSSGSTTPSIPYKAHSAFDQRVQSRMSGSSASVSTHRFNCRLASLPLNSRVISRRTLAFSSIQSST